MILGLTYLDMLHHTQQNNIQQINEKQREILKPFLKKNKNFRLRSVVKSNNFGNYLIKKS